MSNLSDRDNSRDRVSRDGFALMTVQGITTINPTDWRVRVLSATHRAKNCAMLARSDKEGRHENHQGHAGT